MFVALIFAALYAIDWEGVDGAREGRFDDLFFFSVRTLSTTDTHMTPNSGAHTLPAPSSPLWDRRGAPPRRVTRMPRGVPVRPHARVRLTVDHARLSVFRVHLQCTQTSSARWKASWD